MGHPTPCEINLSGGRREQVGRQIVATTGDTSDIFQIFAFECTDFKLLGKSSKNMSPFSNLNSGITLDEIIEGKKLILNGHLLCQVLYETHKLLPYLIMAMLNKVNNKQIEF